MQPKKINLVTDHHLNSGIGRYSFELSLGLQRLGHSVNLFKPFKNDGDDIAFDHKYDWVKKIRYKSLRNLHPYLLPYFIGGRMFFEKADINHAHWFMAGLGLLKARKRNVIVTMHDVSLLHEKEKSGGFTDYYQRSLAIFKKRELPVIVVSEAAKADTIQYAGFNEDRVYAVPNGINFDQFFPMQKEGNEAFKIIYSGGLSPRKNVGLLLRAAKILQDRNVSVKIEIAGNHPNATPYPALVRELGLKSVSFVGFVPDSDMNTFYNQADLMVYTSKYEGFGFAPLEAMATRTPVISTKGGSLNEISGCGALMIDDDAEELAERIIEMKGSQSLREQYAAKGFDWVQQYTWEKTAEKTLAVYFDR